MGFLKEFKDFLNEYKVMALAIAFVMGIATTDLIQSLVRNIIMPLITPLLPGGEWQTAVLALGPFKIGWGPFLASLINFIIIALVIFVLAKYVMRQAKVGKI